MKTVKVNFRPGENTARITGLWQWDYGQKLEIHGLDLPKNVSVEYSINKSEPTTDRIGITENKITVVDIPNEIMELHGDLKVYIRITHPDSGSTEYVISGRIKEREKPSGCTEPEPETENLFGKTIEAVNESAERAEDAEKSAESWAHGHEDYPERDEDNAAYYAGVAKDALEEIPGEVEDAKKAIDAYVREKESQLKGETGNVYFAAFKVVNGRLIMYSDPEIDKVRFVRIGSRLMYRLNF